MGRSFWPGVVSFFVCKNMRLPAPARMTGLWVAIDVCDGVFYVGFVVEENDVSLGGP